MYLRACGRMHACAVQASEVDARELRKSIITKDWKQTLQQALSHQSSKMVAKVRGSHKLDEDLGCDIRRRTKRVQVHVGNAL